MAAHPRVLVLHGRSPAVSPERVSALVDRLREDGFDCAVEPDLGIEEAEQILFVWTGEGELPDGAAFRWKSSLAIFQDVPAETVPEPLRDLPRFLVDTDPGYEELTLHLLVAFETRLLVSKYEFPEEMTERDLSVEIAGPPEDLDWKEKVESIFKSVPWDDSTSSSGPASGSPPAPAASTPRRPSPAPRPRAAASPSR